MERSSFQPAGTVFLIGAGPGEPDLITVRGADILKRADVIVYDRLANPDLLSLTKESSEHIYVGKRPGKPSVSQDQINRILISKAGENKTVARLKGGDPFVFGRGSEECEALAREEIPYEVIPGVSSAIAAPAYAGIPLTHREVSRSFTVVTGHISGEEDPFEKWEHLAHSDTLVILMGMKNLKRIAKQLIELGKSPDTPAAVVEKASYQSQRTVAAPLNEIAKKSEHLSPPATIIIGQLAALHTDLAWFGKDKNPEKFKHLTEIRSKFAG
ncbi:MAG: uroporphyrinogen-III C-methyltransferase [Balneolaceae bacterium]